MDHHLKFAGSSFNASRGAGGSLPGDRVLLRMLDEMEYGMLLVDGGGRVRYSNALGREELGGRGPLQLRDGVVMARDGTDRVALRKALADALLGRRQLLTFESDEQPMSVAVTPMRNEDDESDARLALLVFGKRPDATGLAIDFYARAQGLTGAEAAVLLHLSHGLDPVEIAKRQGVAISTIRSQIASVREKTRAGSIRKLLDRIAMLPPIRTALRSAQRVWADATC